MAYPVRNSTRIGGSAYPIWNVFGLLRAWTDGHTKRLTGSAEECTLYEPHEALKPRRRRGAGSGPKEGECIAAPDGLHNVTPDYEYDSSGRTKNCEHCGASAAEVRAERRKR